VGSQPLIVLDTHALIWWVATPEKLSNKARAAVNAAARRRELIASAITIFEIVTAVRRGRLDLRVAFADWLAALRQLPELSIHPVTDVIAEIAGRRDDTLPADPADRLIASTAIFLDAPLVTADEKLRSVSPVQSVW
jgi:PIN domain nuclease of toxin-antitoxin system